MVALQNFKLQGNITDRIQHTRQKQFNFETSILQCDIIGRSQIWEKNYHTF